MRETEPRLKLALIANFGVQVGTEAAADALAFAWENWSRVSETENPAGYLYGVGRNLGKRLAHTPHPKLPPVPDDATPWIEPGLPEALSKLPERQRVAVILVHCLQWTLSEVGDFMGVSKPTVQKHVERGLAKLRRRIGVKP